MTIELAATSKEGQAFIDSLALLAHPYVYDIDKYPQNLTDTLESALPLAEKVRLSSIWKRIIKYSTSSKSFFKNDPLTQAVTDLAENIKSNGALSKQLDLTAEDVRFFKFWSTYWRTESEPSEKNLKNLVGKCASLPIKSMYTSSLTGEGQRQKALMTQRQNLVHRLIGLDLPQIPVDKAKQAKSSNPEMYSKYLEVNRQINAISKEAIKNISRENGLLSATEIQDLSKKLGIDVKIPEGFVGKMDETGFYTIYDERIDGTPVGQVLMNPKYKKGSSEYVLKYKAPGAQGFQTIYTLEAKQRSIKTKFQKVQDSIGLISKARKLWHQDMSSNDPDLIQLGVIMEIMYICPPRIGTSGNKTGDQETFGLTTIKAKNIRINGKSVVLSYIGKKGSKQANKINGTDKWSKFVCSYLAEVKNSYDPNEDIFSVSAKEVNNYIKNRLHLPISSHKFRTLRGTLLMQELLDSKKFTSNSDQKKVNEFVEQCALEVGKILGHSNTTASGETKIVGSTALQHYIDPAIVFNFYQKIDMRPPTKLETIFKKAGLM